MQSAANAGSTGGVRLDSMTDAEGGYPNEVLRRSLRQGTRTEKRVIMNTMQLKNTFEEDSSIAASG